MNYYERHIGDYLKDTAHLSLLEHGVYTRLMDVYYTRETPIPMADAARLIGARSKEEKQALESVLSEFFVLEADAYVQHRCDTEILKFADKSGKAKRSALARWDAKRSQSDGNANAHANGMRTHSDGNANGMLPIPNPQTPDPNTPKAPKGAALRFEEFWNAWPKGDRKQDRVKCLERWTKSSLDPLTDAILADMAVKRDSEKWRAGFVEAPLVYLNNRRWEDGVETAESGQQREFV